MLLYHGSTRKRLGELCPSDQYVFASHDIRVASIFLAGAKRAACVQIQNLMFAFIGDPRGDILSGDRGGSLYVLDSKSFRPHRAVANHCIEWVTMERVTPVATLEYKSAIRAILTFGARLYFVDDHSFRAIEEEVDYGSSNRLHLLLKIVRRFPCENDIFLKTSDTTKVSNR
jgi:hypothetical protein